MVKRVTGLVLLFGLFLGIGEVLQLPGQQDGSHTNWRPNQVPGGVGYVGAEACAECHSEIFKSQSPTSMGTALEHAAVSGILKLHSSLDFQSGPYHYRITREGEQSIYTVTDGKASLSAPIRWSFGQGFSGQTYVFQHQGEYYESRVSFFTRIRNLDYTLGYPRQPAGSLKEAMGRALSPDETRSCVGCHTTAAVSGKQLNLDRLMPGIRCEACHGPEEKHVKAMKSGNLKIRHIFNPGLLSPDELSQDFCGSCHRSAEEVIQMPGRGDISNIRFQPYRIFHSKCYTDDPRISCVACHNPHQGLNHDPMFYDSRCLACHGAGSAIASQKLSREPAAGADAPACPQGTSRCVSCHMPKMGLPGSHFEFTDHWIRINRPGTPYPI